MGCCFLLRGLFPTQGWSLCLLHWQAYSLLPGHLGSPVSGLGRLKKLKQLEAPPASLSLCSSPLVSLAWRLQSSQASYMSPVGSRLTKVSVLSEKELGGGQTTFYGPAWKSHSTFLPPY